MNGVFGVGPLEMLVVAVLALIFIGPQRLPGVIRQVMSTIREVRSFAAQYQDEARAAFDELQQDLSEAQQELSQAVQDMGQDIAQVAEETQHVMQEADVRPEVSELMAPPPPRDLTEPMGAPANIGTNGASHDEEEPSKPGFADYRPG